MTKRMTKTDLIRAVASQSNLDQPFTKAVIEAFTAIINDLGPGDEVTIPGFGKFFRKESGERMGRYPATGEDVMISARSRIAFKASKVAG